MNNEKLLIFSRIAIKRAIKSDYSFTKIGAKSVRAAHDGAYGTDIIKGVELFQFDNATVDFDDLF